MLIPSDFRRIPWELAHRLTVSFFFRDVVRTSLVVLSLFSASRALLLHALHNFAELVLREHMFEGHVTFERNFQKIVKLRKFRRSQGAVTSTPWAPGLSSLASIGGFRLKARHCQCSGYILKLMCRCIEQPLLRDCLFGSYYNFTTRPNIFYKKIETFVAPARELELPRWLKPSLALGLKLSRTKMFFAASAC